MRFLLANPTASLYNNRTQMVAAIEFACLDMLGQAWGVPVCDILGGRVRDRVPFASYLFFRYAAPDGAGTIRTVDQVVAHARATEGEVRVHHAQDEGRRVPPGLRARVLPRARSGISRRSIPIRSERRSGRRSRRSDSAVRSRISTTTISKIRCSAWRACAARAKGCASRSRRTRSSSTSSSSRQTCCSARSTSFFSTRRSGAAFAPCVKAAGVCETFQLGVAVHSSGELGHSARDDAAPRRRGAEPVVRGRRALSPPRGRHDRGRQAEVRERRDSCPRRVRASACGSIARSSPNTRSSIASWDRIPTIRIPHGRGGRRSCRTIAGPTRTTNANHSYERRAMAGDKPKVGLMHTWISICTPFSPIRERILWR